MNETRKKTPTNKNRNDVNEFSIEMRQLTVRFQEIDVIQLKKNKIFVFQLLQPQQTEYKHNNIEAVIDRY